MRFTVRGHACTTLDAYADEDWTDDPESTAIAVLVRAYREGRRKALVFPEADLPAVLDALTDLSNTEDEAANDKARIKRDPEGARFARLASWGLTRLSQRIVASTR